MGKSAEAYRAEGRVQAYKLVLHEIMSFAKYVNAPIEINPEFENYHHALKALDRAIGARERRNVAHRLGLLS